jgi:hypothetical protein
MVFGEAKEWMLLCCGRGAKLQAQSGSRLTVGIEREMGRALGRCIGADVAAGVALGAEIHGLRK